HELPWPATRGEADELWRLRIKQEVLLEKLARDKAAETKAAAAKADAEKKARLAAVAPSTGALPGPQPSTTTATAKVEKAPAKEPSIKETIDTRYDRLLR